MGELKSYEKLVELKDLLYKKLSSKYVTVSGEDTIFDLARKIDTIPPYVEKGKGLVPSSPNTNQNVEFPVLDDDVREVYSKFGVTYDEATGRYYNSVTDYPYKSWPHFSYTMNNAVVKVPNSRLRLDVECSNMFNMSVWYRSDDEEDKQQAWLDDIDGRGLADPEKFVDFPGPRVSGTYKFGAYLRDHMGHINPPKVEHKYNLLEKATGKTKNYKFFTLKTDTWGSQRSFGKWNAEEGAPLMNTAEIDIDKTPYLYYSISQPNNSPFTFALYTDRVWFLGRDGAYNNETSLMTTNSTQEYYTLPQRKIDGNQTGCIDLRNWISGGKLQIKELKLYGATDGNSAGLPQTDCTINYLFFGSEPVKTYGTGWGEPATPNNVILGNAAVGGEVTIDRIDYYVVGRGTDRDWLKINDVTFAYDNS